MNKNRTIPHLLCVTGSNKRLFPRQTTTFPPSLDILLSLTKLLPLSSLSVCKDQLNTIAWIGAVAIQY